MSQFENFRTRWGLAASDFREGNSERRPFLPWGLIPAVGLCATFIFTIFHFSVGNVQRTAEIKAEEALSAIGANWAEVSASGQWITIEGEAPTGEMAKAATRAVRAVTDRTPFGFNARPVTRVNNKASIRQVPVTPPVEVSTRHDWSYALDRGVLKLSGQVPDEGTRRKILNAANLRLDPPRFASVEDELVITGRPAEAGFDATATRGINTLSRCDAGVASFNEATFSLSCEAQAVRLNEINMLANAPLEFGTAGRLDVFSAAQAEACDRTLMDLLNSARVEFASSSALIRRISDDLLDDVSDAATRCPGILMIEGHTDSSGLPETNQALSLERASAVRAALIERGVDASRLQATGFGARRPLETNDTADGRARNRRIEIKVNRANDND